MNVGDTELNELKQETSHPQRHSATSSMLSLPEKIGHSTRALMRVVNNPPVSLSGLAP